MQGPDTDAQDHPLHLFTSGLQRTAGPYRWVIRVTLTARSSLPVFLDKQTLSVSVGMSERCQERTHALLIAGPPPAQPKLLRRRRYGQDARHFPAARRLHRSPTVTIPAIVPTAVVCVCGANNAVTRSISAVVCGRVGVRGGVLAVGVRLSSCPPTPKQAGTCPR